MRFRFAHAFAAAGLLFVPLGPRPAPSPAFAAFVDRYLDAFALRHPSIAAGNGIHDHDDRLEDFSAAAIAAEIADLKRQRAELRAFDDAALTPDERVDKRILDGIIDGWLLEQEMLENWRRNPMLYASAITDGVHNLVMMESASAPVRIRRVLGKLQRLPPLLAAARANLVNPPRLLAERGLAMMRAASDLVGRDLRLAFEHTAGAALEDSLWRAAGIARAQINDYAAYLEREVIPKANGDFVIGAENLSRRFRAEELIDLPLDRLVQIGERELERNERDFRAAAARIDASRDPLAVWRDGRRSHPQRGEVIAATQRIVDSLSAFVRTKNLATVPPGERVIVAPSLPFDLGGASMHASPPLEPVPVKSFYYTSDVAAGLTAEQEQAGLERHNTYSVTITSAHEAMPGHWLHSLYMRRTPGKIRRIWIGLNPFPQPSSGQDGWAHYAEQLVVEQGFGGGDPRYVMAQRSDALMRICRLLSGVRLHTRAWSLEQAADCFEHKAHLATAAARREAERGAYDPTYGGYFLGKLGFLKLRTDYAAKLGARFGLREFHERVMSNGIAPLWAQRQLLLPGDVSRVIE